MHSVQQDPTDHGHDGPSFSIVIETANVNATRHHDLLNNCLQSLARQGPWLRRAHGVFLVVRQSMEEMLIDGLCRDFPWLTVVRADSRTGYIGLKLFGSEFSDSEAVLFCDADVDYEENWIEAMLSAMRNRPDALTVGGETSTRIRGPWSLALALTFVFPRFTGESAVVPSPIYWANNVAIRRGLLHESPIPDPKALYRGQNIVHSVALIQRGQVIFRQPAARAWHHVVQPAEIASRYFRLGVDAVRIARLARDDEGVPYLAAMPPDASGGNSIRKFVGRVFQILRTNPRHVFLMPLALPLVTGFAACWLAGRVAALVRPMPQENAPY